jgi:hypothetical protein
MLNYALQQGKLNMVELGVPKEQAFKQSASLAIDGGDFPVSLLADEKHGCLFVLTKSGKLLVHEAQSGKQLFAQQAARATMFVSCAHSSNGIVAVDQVGVTRSLLSINTHFTLYLYVPFLDQVGVSRSLLSINTHFTLYLYVPFLDQVGVTRSLSSIFTCRFPLPLPPNTQFILHPLLPFPFPFLTRRAASATSTSLSSLSSLAFWCCYQHSPFSFLPFLNLTGGPCQPLLRRSREGGVAHLPNDG